MKTKTAVKIDQKHYRRNSKILSIGNTIVATVENEIGSGVGGGT